MMEIQGSGRCSTEQVEVISSYFYVTCNALYHQRTDCWALSVHIVIDTVAESQMG